MRLFLVLLAGCAISHHPTAPWEAPAASAPDLTTVLETPTDLEIDVIISATWMSELSGLLDLSHPNAAGFTDREVPIHLPVVRVRHPTQGTLFIDAGVDRDIVAGGHGAARGVVRGFLDGIEGHVALGDLLDAEERVHGVLLTHSHMDHVLGLPDVPAEIPIITGPDDLDTRDVRHGFSRGTYQALFANHTVIHELDLSDGVELGGIEGSIDLLGDGSVWAIPAPGHTYGSTVFFLNSTTPTLILGDASHTCWGWLHDVPPGHFSHDEEGAAASFARLRTWARQIPDLVVVAGHTDCDTTF